jgi:hypothetical protein
VIARHTCASKSLSQIWEAADLRPACHCTLLCCLKIFYRCAHRSAPSPALMAKLQRVIHLNLFN